MLSTYCDHKKGYHVYLKIHESILYDASFLNDL